MASKISGWLKKVQQTQDEEIDCSACLEQISEYVDLELASGTAAGRMPQVKQHLDMCAACAEEYQLLHELARLESEDRLPPREDLADQL